jgi:hypothetical protein
MLAQQSMLGMAPESAEKRLRRAVKKAKHRRAMLRIEPMSEGEACHELLPQPPNTQERGA